MKKIIRSMLVMIAIVMALVITTSGFFRSDIKASGNRVTTGTFEMAIDAMDAATSSQPYSVMSVENSVIVQKNKFPPLDTLLPGEKRTLYISLRNIGSIPYDFRVNFKGTWGDSALDAQNMIEVADVKRFQSGNCEGDIYCTSLVSWLNLPGLFAFAGNPTSFGNLGSMSTTAGSNYFGNSNTITDNINRLNVEEYQVFKVDLLFKPEAGNDFQGKSFTYDLFAQSKQINAPSF